jgi:hypothetical protein
LEAIEREDALHLDDDSIGIRQNTVSGPISSHRNRESNSPFLLQLGIPALSANMAFAARESSFDRNDASAMLSVMVFDWQRSCSDLHVNERWN